MLEQFEYKKKPTSTEKKQKGFLAAGLGDLKPVLVYSRYFAYIEMGRERERTRKLADMMRCCEGSTTEYSDWTAAILVMTMLEFCKMYPYNI